MATKAWKVDSDGHEHYVELDHGTVTGTRTIKVDDQVVVDEGMHIVDFGDKIDFTVGDRTAVLEISTAGFDFDYTLKIDDRVVPAIN